MRIPEQRRRFGVAASAVRGAHPGKRGPSLPRRTVGIAGFDAFQQVSRAASCGVRPSKGTKIKLPASKVPKFVPGAGRKAAVDPKAVKR